MEASGDENALPAGWRAAEILRALREDDQRFRPHPGAQVTRATEARGEHRELVEQARGESEHG